jgi:hypothetical protein
MRNLKEIFIDSLRMYFAPLIGAYKATIAESERYHHRSKES